MSLERCIQSAKKWLKENTDVELSARELEQVGKLLSSAEELGATPAEKNRLMQDVIERKLEIEQAKNRARQYLNAIMVERAQKQIKANIESWTAEGKMDKGKAATEGFLAFIRGGSFKPGQGTNLDPLYLHSSTYSEYLQFFRSALGSEDARVLQSLKIGDSMSRDIYQELAAIENKTQLGQSNNDTALRIAKSIRATQDFVLNDVKGVNPYVEAAKDFLVHRNHDRDLISAVPKEQWVKEAMHHFSGSFLGATPEEKLVSFGAMYDDIKAGVYGNTDFDAESFWKPGGTSGDQAARSHSSRVLVAADWMNEWQYAAKYGDSIWANMQRQLSSQARNVARLQKWAPNASENFQRLYNSILKTLPPDAKPAFTQAKEKFKEAFEVTMGRQDNEAHGMLARVAQNLMSFQNAAGLGLHVPRSLNGVQAAITLARDAFGNSYVENAAHISSGIAKAMLQADGGREAAQALGAALRETARDAMGQLMPQTSKPGTAARIGEAIGKLSLTDRWVANQKFGMVNLLTHELGTRAGVPFERLPPETQQMLGRYSIGSREWAVLKDAVIQDGPLKGKITPESIRGLTREQVGPLLENDTPREAARVRGELARNYGVLLNDQAGLVVGESNSRSRIAAYGTTSINDAWGIARRVMMQFKQAALIRQQLFQRTLQSGGGSTSNIGGVFQYAIGAAFLSMVGEGMIALATGKSLPSPGSHQMLAHAARGTGMLGIFGDVLANALSQPTADKTQQVLSSDVLGPAFGTISRGVVAGAQTARGVGQALRGEDAHFGGKYWAQLIHGLTPGQNLFYTKAALDYLFLNELHEFMGGGGYLEGLRRSVGRNEGWPENLGGSGDKQHYTFGGKNFWE